MAEVVVRIRLLQDTAANFTSNNPILLQGELGYEIDTGKFKVGDGTTAWNSLPYKVDQLLTAEEKSSLTYISTLSSNAQDQLNARCLESVFGAAIGNGLRLDGATLKADREFRKLDKTGDYEITETDIITYKYFTNQGASGGIDLTPPAVSYMAGVIFVVSEPQIIKLSPPTDEAFRLDLVLLDANDCVDSPTDIGAMLTAVRMQDSNGNWFWNLASFGAWVDAGASE